jgi:hypothetical protein
LTTTVAGENSPQFSDVAQVGDVPESSSDSREAL